MGKGYGTHLVSNETYFRKSPNHNRILQGSRFRRPMPVFLRGQENNEQLARHQHRTDMH